jgi:hypothetical protein
MPQVIGYWGLVLVLLLLTEDYSSSGGKEFRRRY